MSAMKTDTVTKLLLGAIALFLGIIAVSGVVAPSPAFAQRVPPQEPKFAHLQLVGDKDGFYMFDTVSGRIWYYGANDFRARPEKVGQVEEPGERLNRQ